MPLPGTCPAYAEYEAVAMHFGCSVRGCKRFIDIVILLILQQYGTVQYKLRLPVLAATDGVDGYYLHCVVWH